MTVEDFPAIATPSGDVPVSVMVCSPTMASVTEALVRVHVLVEVTQARSVLRAVGTTAA